MTKITSTYLKLAENFSIAATSISILNISYSFTRINLSFLKTTINSSPTQGLIKTMPETKATLCHIFATYMGNICLIPCTPRKTHSTHYRTNPQPTTTKISCTEWMIFINPSVFLVGLESSDDGERVCPTPSDSLSIHPLIHIFIIYMVICERIFILIRWTSTDVFDI